MAPTAREDDLVALLRERNDRVRAFAANAVELAGRRGMPTADVGAACAGIEQYFAEAFPLHVRDEEESILPRIPRISPIIDAALAAMREQHELNNSLVERLCRAVSELRQAPEEERARAALGAVAEPFRTFIEAHLALEEAVIFPSVRRLLSTTEQSDIVWEMQNRRR